MDDTKPHDYALYLAADQKIDHIKEQVRELYQRDQANQEKIDRLNSRVENGVAPTGQSNAQRTSDLALKVNDLENRFVAMTTSLEHHDRILARVVSGIFWFSFAGLLGGLLGLAYQVLKIKLLGG